MSFTPFSSVQSILNYSQTPLSGAGTYTGTWEKSLYGQIQLRSVSDVAGTVYVDFSSDEGTTTLNTVSYPCSANKQSIHRLVSADYFRIRYINGSSAQSSFDISVSHGIFGPITSSMNFPYSLSADAALVRPSWTWLDVARGLATGIEVVEKFGRNAAVGTSFVPVCFSGHYRTPQSGSATTLRIKAGGNASDTAAGSGAREITIIGLDENFAVATEAIATNGALASSSTTTTFTRVYRAYVSASGTYATESAGSHAGDITIENTAGTEDWAKIDSTNFPKSQTEIGAFSVPAGNTAYVKLRHVTVDTGKTIDVVFFQRLNIDETAAPYTAMRAQSVLSGVTGGEIQAFGEADVPLGPYAGPCDVGFMAKVSTGTASVAVEFEIFLVAE